MVQSAPSVRPARIPLFVKLGYSAFLAVLVPYYWVSYTPWNFLYFCDVALLLTLVAIWRESSLLVSMAAVGILLPQALWIADFAVRAVTGTHITGMTAYMFNDAIPLFVRALSSFHGWLPLLLTWLVVRLGYDRRALGRQAVLAVAVLLVCYGLAPVPPAPPSNPNHAVNINYVYGLSDAAPQTTFAPGLWFALLTVVTLGLYVPTHLALAYIRPRISPHLQQARNR